MALTAQMTADAKRALARTIRTLRARLIEDLGAAMEGAYRLSIDAKKAALDAASRARRTRLDGWVDEQVRALPVKCRAGAVERLRGEVVKDAAATLLQRLVYVRLLESTGLRKVKVVTAGWESGGYKDFREAASELVRADETEGYATLLALVFDELALDLPGLFGPVRMCALVPVPASTLRAVISALDDEELASVWQDDTTLGWIYQYWNDPEREALDAKLAASKKLENHEIASKTQMFTERYMVEWLLHNSLGQMWLAMCRKHGWTADVERTDGGSSVLDRLDARRADWRARREAGQVPLDALMPIEAGLEDRWKYWVPQPMPDDAAGFAPDSLRTLKLLDPACGSGHFLVIASELLFHLYEEEARHRGETWTDREIVESILENNLHGIDIDPRAVQIAAAALMLKARQLCADVEPATLNLVAPNLSLAGLAADDPARLALYKAVEDETGIPPALTGKILSALAGADHLGSLLEVDAEIDAAIGAWNAELSQPVPDQGTLFSPSGGFGARRRKRITADQARATVLARLESFLAHHGHGPDLGLRLRGEQLAAGVRFIRMAREGQYDLVVANPPYQATERMADKAYIELHYRRGKADLYASFIERSLRLTRTGGIAGLLTMRNWMFIKQFAALRDHATAAHDLRVIGDLESGAFADINGEVVSVAMVVLRRAGARGAPSVALRPATAEDAARDGARTARKRASLLAQCARHEFFTSRIGVVPTSPILYWWSEELYAAYAAAPKVSDVATVRVGLQTGNNARFVRLPWEIRPGALCTSFSDENKWAPFINGGEGRAWFEPLSAVVRWAPAGLQMREPGALASRPQNMEVYFRRGIAFSMIGSAFAARAHRHDSIIGNKGSSIFCDEPARVLCALNSKQCRSVLTSFNPGIGFEVGDVLRAPIPPIANAGTIVRHLERAFAEHEAHREPSVEARRPGPSRWEAAQAWAQDEIEQHGVVGSDLPPAWETQAEPAVSHLSFALGIALGRFGADGEGVRQEAPPGALPHGILFLCNSGQADSLAGDAAQPLRAAWERYGQEIDGKRSLSAYLREAFFSDVHRTMYENRPIYFPLSSTRKSFVAYVAIHRWTASTLNHLLAEHLYPVKKHLACDQTELRHVRDGADKKAARDAEKRLGQVGKWLDELNELIADVEMCAEKGPPPPDTRTKPREVDARYEPDLDDGVMINSAALWPLLEPQWKDPKKWWKELSNAEGKRDHDWARLTKRYFPTRVDEKCRNDPSLAIAHGCFWKHHPVKAYQWELRLQDEIRPDFTIDEEGSDAARASFLAEHAEEAEALVVKEHGRRQKKKPRADKADDDEMQRDLDLGDDETDDDEELSA